MHRLIEDGEVVGECNISWLMIGGESSGNSGRAFVAKPLKVVLDAIWHNYVR